MKRFFSLLILCSLLLSGCAFRLDLPDIFPFDFPDWEDGPVASTPTAPAKTTLPAPTYTPGYTEAETIAQEIMDIRVNFQVFEEEGQEYARITATGDDGTTLWTVETNRYDQAQLYRVCEVGACPWKQKYYYVDDGDVVALDLYTGSELWRYAGFDGTPVGKDAVYIDVAGTVYLCGYFGPDYFAIDTNGNVLDCIQQLHPDYYGAHKLIPGDGVMTVCLSGGPEGDMGWEAIKIKVSTAGYP